MPCLVCPDGKRKEERFKFSNGKNEKAYGKVMEYVNKEFGGKFIDNTFEEHAVLRGTEEEESRRCYV